MSLVLPEVQVGQRAISKLPLLLATMPAMCPSLGQTWTANQEDTDCQIGQCGCVHASQADLASLLIPGDAVAVFAAQESCLRASSCPAARKYWACLTWAGASGPIDLTMCSWQGHVGCRQDLGL